MGLLYKTHKHMYKAMHNTCKPSIDIIIILNVSSVKEKQILITLLYSDTNKYIAKHPQTSGNEFVQ